MSEHPVDHDHCKKLMSTLAAANLRLRKAIRKAIRDAENGDPVTGQLHDALTEREKDGSRTTT